MSGHKGLRDEVLRLRREEGLGTRAIARELGLSPSTVSIHLKNANIAPGNRYDDPAVALPLSKKWASTRPQLVKPATKEPWERVAIVSDMHPPYHNMKLIEAAVEIIRDYEPHRIIFNGDCVADFPGISRWRKFSGDYDIQAELDAGRGIKKYFHKKIIHVLGDQIIWDEVLGNHDERWITYIEEEARGLRGLRDLTPERQFGWDEFNINPHPRGGFLLRPYFIVEHGHVARGEAGASAKARAMSTLISGCMGHTHRLAPYVKTGFDRRIEWWEGGALCQNEAEYLIGSSPNWQPGFLLGEFHTKKEIFNITPVKAIGDGFLYGGREYGRVAA